MIPRNPQDFGTKGQVDNTLKHALHVPVLQRAQGHAKIGLCSDSDQNTRLTRLFQQGCLKVRLPRPELDGSVDAVLINTSGGLTGGDALSIEVDLGEGARATVTTPGCERIYRSIGGEALIHHRLQVGRHARLDWLPQETILFDRCRLRRSFDIRLLDDAEVTVAEAILFGRTAMGETVESGFLSDFWTVHRGGRMLYADAMRIAEPFGQTIAGPTTLGGYAAMASLVHVGNDLEAKRDALRLVFTELNGLVAGASVVGGVLVARMLARSSRALRSMLITALYSLRERRPLPRNWLC